MAINPNNGVLDIINGTLKVSSIDIKQAAGFTTTLNTVARNDVLLFDDQKASTVFTPTSEGGYMSSTGVTRDTTEGAGYIDLNDGWVYWPIQLPNSWHTEFDMHVTTTGGVLTFSLFNTSEPNHTDYTNNDGGYKIVFDNTTNKLILYYEGSPHKLGDVNIRSPDWQHVNINYFQGAISVSLAGKVVLTHEFTQNYQEFNSRYVGFSATTGASHKIRHLRVHNSDKWLYTKTSNASDITYVSGNVGIGTLTPTELLDVHGNVHIAKDLTVNGNLTVSGTTTFIDTQNLAIEDPIIEVARGNASDTIDAGLVITRATSNVAVAYRGDEEELALGYTQSGASDTDVTPITDGGLDVRVYGNLFANNLTTTANVEATYLKGNGSEITHVTLDQVVDYGNTTANTIHLTNTDVGLKADGNVDASYFIGNGSKLTGLVTDLQSVTDNGNVTSNTVQFTNATTAFVADSNVGIGTDTPAANLHVVGYQYVNDPPTIANSFDHSDAPLTLTHGTPTSTTAVDDPKAVLHLTRDGTDGESYGSKASFKMSRYENSGTASRSRLDVALTDGTYTESTVMTLRADGKVGIGTTAPGYTLDVRGTANVGALTATSISGPLSGNADTATSLETARTIGGESFDGTANIDLPGVNTVGTQNTSGNAATATALETARTIGGESFDGTANIDLPGVNTAGTQNTSGNAATATALETARTIGGESFDGTANIDLPGVNTAGTQNTSGNADTATTATNQSGGTVSATTGTFSGNVGIGTTSPATYLHLSAKNGDPGSTEGDLVGTHTLTEYLRFTSRGDVGDVNGVTVGFKLGGDDNSSVNPDGRLDICANDGASAGNEYGLTPDRTIATFLGSGNVGIGTTSPSHPLTIQETTTNTNTVTYPLAIRAISSGTVANGFGAGIRFQCERRDTDDYQSLAGSVEVYGGGNLPGTSDLWNMRFGVRNNDTAVTPMTLRYDGNVGIGTGSPLAKFTISSNYYGGQNDGFCIDANDGSAYNFRLHPFVQAAGKVGYNIRVNNASSSYDYAMVFGGDGNVGIGTSSPGHILHVEGASSTSPIYKGAGAAATSTFSFILNAPRPGTTSGGATHFINGSTRTVDGGQSTYTIRNDNGALNLGNSNHATRILSNSFEYSNGDASVTVYGPNTTWNSYLFVGAASDRNPNNNSDRAQVISTNGNLHLDAGGSRDIYMNYYSGNYIRHNGLGVYSDDRLKTNEELITNATETLLKLKPQKYTKAWTLNETELREPHTETGLIAQDIWYDAPELRHIVLLGQDANPSETKPSEPVPGDIQQDPDYSSWGPNEASVNYDGLIAYLIKSNQELHTEIQTLKSRIDALEN